MRPSCFIRVTLFVLTMALPFATSSVLAQAGIINVGLASGDNVGFTRDQILEGDLVAFRVHESREDNVDLNGDGDASDLVLHIYDANANTTTNLGLDADHFDLHGNLVAFRVHEGRQGNTDLNGDGDTAASVLHVYDVATEAIINLGLDAFFTPFIQNF